MRNILSSKRRPILVSVIAIILFLIAIYTLVNSVIIAVGILGGNPLYNTDNTQVKSIITNSSGQQSVVNTGTVFISGGIFNVFALLIVTLLFIILGIGLLQTRNWARIIVIIISIFLAIVCLSGLLQGYFINVPELFIFVAIATYLIASRRVKDAFKKVK